jgi:hypothetical protein
MTSTEQGAAWQADACTECRFEPTSVAPEQIAAEIEKVGTRFRAPLTRGLPGEDLPSLLRTRPAPETWSALETACHVRGVLEIFDERVRQVVEQDHPTFGWWEHEAAVTDEHYNEQDPAEVLDAINAAATVLATRLRSIPDGSWERTGERRDGEVFTAAGLGRFALHEANHHLLDVGRALRAARGR